jgi:hypothetical protein
MMMPPAHEPVATHAVPWNISAKFAQPGPGRTMLAPAAQQTGFAALRQSATGSAHSQSTHPLWQGNALAVHAEDPEEGSQQCCVLGSQ